MVIKIFQYILLLIFVSVLVVYLFFAFYLFFRQKQLIFLPVRGKVNITPKSIGLDYENIFVPVGGGEGRVHLWFIPSICELRYTLLICHGNAGNLGDRVEYINVIHQLGLNIAIFDYRGYGESSPGISEETTYEDAISVFDYLVGEKGIPEDKIIVLGRSLGGGVACELALRRPNLAGLILDSTFTSIDDIAKKMYPLFPVRVMLRIHYNNFAKISRVQCPILLIHSEKDEIVPFVHSQMLFYKRKKCGEVQFLQIRYGGHNDLFLISQDEYVRGIKAFLESKIDIQGFYGEG